MTSTYKLANNIDASDIETLNIKHDFIPQVRQIIYGKLAAKYGNVKPIKLWTKKGEESYSLWRDVDPFEDGMTIYYTPPEIYKMHVNMVDYNDKTVVTPLEFNSNVSEHVSHLIRASDPGALWWVRDKNFFADSYIPWDGAFKQNMKIYYSQYKAAGGKRKNKSRKRQTKRLKKRKNKSRRK